MCFDDQHERGRGEDHAGYSDRMVCHPKLDKKVLLIDLDPQANASQSVMSPASYVEYLDKGGLTVADIFEQFTPTGTCLREPKEARSTESDLPPSGIP